MFQNPVILPDLPVFQRPAGHCVVAFVHAAQHLLPILPDRFPGVAGDGDLLLGAFGWWLGYGIIFCFFSHDLYSFFQPLSFWIFAVFFAIFTISIIIVTVYNHVKGNPVIENISE